MHFQLNCEFEMPQKLVFPKYYKFLVQNGLEILFFRQNTKLQFILLLKLRKMPLNSWICRNREIKISRNQIFGREDLKIKMQRNLIFCKKDRENNAEKISCFKVLSTHLYCLWRFYWYKQSFICALFTFVFNCQPQNRSIIMNYVLFLFSWIKYLDQFQVYTFQGNLNPVQKVWNQWRF